MSSSDPATEPSPAPPVAAARADLAAARCLVALRDVEARGGWDASTHLALLRWSLSRHGSPGRARTHRARARIDLALGAIAAGGVDARWFDGLGPRDQRGLERDLTQLARVLANSARIGSAPLVSPPGAG